MADVRKYDSTYGYDSSGKRQNLYLKDGQGYTQDGNRVGAGWTVQTGGGIFQMGNDGRGYKVQEHNRARPDYSAMESFLNTNREASTYTPQDFTQKGKDRYTPIYEAKRQALEHQRDSGVRDLEGQMAGVNTEYDRNLEAQADNAKRAKAMHEVDLINRGMTRSSYASDKSASLDVMNNREVNYINQNRANAINSIHSKIQSLKEGIGGQLSQLDQFRPEMEQQMADQLEDRDFNMWYKQAGLKQGDNQMQYNLLRDKMDNEFQMNLNDWNRDKEINSAMSSLGWGGKNSISQEAMLKTLQEREADRLNDKEYQQGQDRLKARFTEGTPEYELNQLMKKDNLSQQEAMMKLQQKYTPSYGGGGGKSYGGYSGKSYGGGYSGNSSGYEQKSNYQEINNAYGALQSIKSDPNLSAKEKFWELRELQKEFRRNPNVINSVTSKDRDYLNNQMESAMQEMRNMEKRENTNTNSNKNSNKTPIKLNATQKAKQKAKNNYLNRVKNKKGRP